MPQRHRGAEEKEKRDFLKYLIFSFPLCLCVSVSAVAF
jgi:hypothetical protein